MTRPEEHCALKLLILCFSHAAFIYERFFGAQINYIQTSLLPS